MSTVKQIKGDDITFYRPYTHTGDCSYTGGVLCYVGVEEWTDDKNRDRDWELVSRTVLK